MEIEWDQAKNDDCLASHGLRFADFAGYDTQPAVVVDDRYEYGETRYRAFGRIDGKGYCLVYIMRGTTMRLIKLPQGTRQGDAPI